MSKTKIILFICAGLFVLSFLTYTYVKTPVLTHGFAAYYTFSKIALEEKDVSKSYDTTYFYAKMKDYGFGDVKDYPNNIPTNSLMLMPLVGLNPVYAKIVWNVFSIIFFCLALILLIRAFGIPFNSSLCLLLIFLVFIFRPLWINIVFGQAYIFLLFLFSLSVYGFKKNNLWPIAIPIALVFLFKGYAVYAIIFLCIAKRWKEVGIVFLTVALIFLITLPIIHLDTWIAYYEKVIAVIGQDKHASNVAYQTVNGFIRHCFTGFSNGSLSVLVILVNITAILFLAKGYKRNQLNPSVLFCGFIALNVLLAPVAEEHHYVLFIPVIIFLTKMFYENPSEYKIEVVLSIIFFIILSAPYNYKSMQDSQFPFYLLAYLKLFSGVGLLIIFKKVLLPPKLIYKTV